MSKVITTLLLVGISSAAYAQCGPFLPIVDGHLQIGIEINGLAGIQAISPEGRLSLDTIEMPELGIEIDSKAPFPQSATVVVNTPNEIVIGVLGAENRIDIEGGTITAIQYDGDKAMARRDLTVNVGIGDAAPAAFPCPEPSGGSLVMLGLLSLFGIRPSRKQRRVDSESC